MQMQYLFKTIFFIVIQFDLFSKRSSGYNTTIPLFSSTSSASRSRNLILHMAGSEWSLLKAVHMVDKDNLPI